MQKLAQKLAEAAQKTATFFKSRLKADGSYGKGITDLACYYKSPKMFCLLGMPEQAAAVLDYTKETFMCPNGDFFTNRGVKSLNPAYCEFYTYTNGWLVSAGQMLKDSELATATRFMDNFYAKSSGGFLTHPPEKEDGVTDILTTAHNGLLHLERGNIDTAIASGLYLCRALELQPSDASGFYLRVDSEGKLVTTFSKEAEALHIVKRTEPDQLYFMIGYPMAFLALLYQATKKEMFLDAAKEYFKFAESCGKFLLVSDFSHKVAWASSILYSIAPTMELQAVIEPIMTRFLENQSTEGVWFMDVDKNTAYDQSAELACWCIETSKNIQVGLEKLTSPKSKTGSQTCQGAGFWNDAQDAEAEEGAKVASAGCSTKK